MRTKSLTSKVSVGDVVAAIPVAARVLDQYGVDYSIDSDLRFEQACAALSLDAAMILSEIEAESGSWRAFTSRTTTCSHAPWARK